MTQTSLSAATLAHRELDAAFLIYGSAIKSRANLRCFNHMRISNRRLKGGLRIILSAVSEIFGRASSLVAIQPPLARKFLIGTIDISENELSSCKHSSYQNSNGHKIGFSETPDCECVAAESHSQKVISYRAGGRRMLLPGDTTEQGLTSPRSTARDAKGAEEVSYMDQRMPMNFSRRIFSFVFAVSA